MSRIRHRAKGGGVKKDFYAGGESNVAKEAEEKKKGGRVHGEGHEGKKRTDRARARGGMVPGRKVGGGIGSNLHPLTTAARVKHVTKGEQPEEGDHSD